MSLSIKPDERILIVAPHPDDETIGCGGLMLSYPSQCEILLLTDGRKGYDSRFPTDEDALAEQREKELNEVAKTVGINKVYCLKIPDGEVAEHEEFIAGFDIRTYAYVFVPNRFERHKDHAPALAIIQKMKRKQKAKAKLFEYEVWSPLAHPTDMTILDSLIDQKLDLVRKYQSQIRFLDYEAMTEALNRYRGAGNKIKYAEVYAYLPELNTAKRLFRFLPGWMQNLLRRLMGRNSTNNIIK